ncbi:Inner membrane lipoprotein YiaD precursor [Limihaloglobus sulfuriphilus]|uniref:Inner membrane lipoprotein YiaD n=1 Tax=Limihaloglobus sulfuriphilus TaxID=1851148 RepID=A0A1R7T676_9BACT|nr:OmpA family protein [Limihaloglobus sulfuriphilus]AQQ72446.1 Inner membrane lipoprotein YiaD precursor [Limihaloglobus sulfuriphilus]
MRNTGKSVIVMLLGVFVITMFTGCTNWKKRYEGLEVEHENLKSRYQVCVGSLDSAKAETGSLAGRIQSYESTIAELEDQLAQNKSTGEASGFGDQYDVAYDAEKGTLTVTLPNAILFAPGKASLKSARNADLNHIISVLQGKYQGKDIDIVGHTDSDPISKSSWADNWQLSAERALSVLRYLKNNGIDQAKIRAVACGPARPVASNATASGKAENRRVEIVVNMK